MSKLLTNYELDKIGDEIDEINEVNDGLNTSYGPDNDILDRNLHRLDELIEILEKSEKQAKIHERGLRLITGKD